MRVIDRIEQVRKELDGVRGGGGTVGLVPTMGALHRGHTSLIRRSAAECDATVVSVFVNPLQFGPSEDFARYPRDLSRDVEAADEAGADLVFAPPVEEMYGSGSGGDTDTRSVVRVVVDGPLGTLWEGASRPGHFSGVATVVAKLFAIAGPCRAYFGEKDWQQLLVVQRVAADLSLPVEVVGCPTVREADGLALSSRNAYLSAGERRAATVLSRALSAAAEAGDPAVMAGVVAREPLARLDYAGVLDGRLVIAAVVGTTRLIDNLPLPAEGVD